MNYVALKAELDAGHPDTGAYNADNQLAADQINLVNRTRNRVLVTGKEVKDRIKSEDWGSRSDAQKAQLLALFARDDLDPFGIDAVIFTDIMTGALGSSVADLTIYRVEDISRGEELGFGVLTAPNIETARTV